MTEAIEFTDRYSGGSGPDLKTMCLGLCEGMGRYPVNKLDPDLTEYERKQIAKAPPQLDLWYFIECGTCHGSGKRTP